MSMFTRSSKDVQQASAPPTEQGVPGGQPDPASLMPGVVPPPAAPVYSTRPAEGARTDGGAQSSVAEKVRIAREAQQSVRERVRLAVQRARGTPPAREVQSRPVPQTAPAPTRSVALRYPFDPVSYAQTGLLNLAWSWQEAGAPIRAIHTYMELLCRYPDSAAADAAVADLVALSEKLAREGRFHTALAIYDQLEHLA